MALPPSFAKDGFGQLQRGKFRRLLIGADGPPDSGKTEFALSIPGPGIGLCLDRGIDGCLLNPDPPASRNPDWAHKIITVPTATMAEDFKAYWKTYYGELTKALANQDCRAILIDGDSDSWELQRLAEFGKLTQIPSIMYTGVNAARRALYARCWDASKVIIATNKIKKVYRDKMGPDGKQLMSDSGKPIREWDGTYDRQGFDDQEYLWQIQLSHFYDDVKKIWGIRITKCKANKKLEGEELWGDYCNFACLVQTVYPQVPLSEWGFK